MISQILLMASALAATPTVTQVKAEVLQELKDPGSAQFRGIKLLRDDQGKAYGFCGYVNAKNSFGGYTGENYFLYNFRRQAVALVPAELTSSDMC